MIYFFLFDKVEILKTEEPRNYNNPQTGCWSWNFKIGIHHWIQIYQNIEKLEGEAMERYIWSDTYNL
jgi:hypothetical protein